MVKMVFLSCFSAPGLFLGDTIDLIISKQTKFSLSFEKIILCSEFENEFAFYLKKLNS
jgi:hypothetical protein